MTSLNPVYTCGEQIAESVKRHEGLGRAEARKRAIEMLDQSRYPPIRGTTRGRISASDVGRHAPARDDRGGARVPPVASDRGRANHRARCDDSGADPRSVEAASVRARHGRRSSSLTIWGSSPKPPIESPSCMRDRSSKSAMCERRSPAHSTRTPRRSTRRCPDWACGRSPSCDPWNGPEPHPLSVRVPLSSALSRRTGALSRRTRPSGIRGGPPVELLSRGRDRPSAS